MADGGGRPDPGAVNRLRADATPEQPDLMQALAEGQAYPLHRHWNARLDQHEREEYAGIRISKFPEDLRTYERVIWERRPQVIIEIGVQFGGSLLWLRDRLFDFQRYRCGPAPRVLGVDTDTQPARDALAALPVEAQVGIELIDGDIAEHSTLAAVHERVPDGAEVFIIEDARHDFATTMACLRGVAALVRPGGYYQVEDTCVDVELLRRPHWPQGAGVALAQWLSEDPLGQRFRRRPDLQSYGLTCHPGGLLQRVEGG